MSEDFLHFIWNNGLWDYSHQVLADGRKFEVIDRGTINFDAGPDFFNAKIKIDNTVWVGNVEIHTKSSHWYRHNHHLDDAYDNVVLHVVFTHDKEIYNRSNELIPVFEMRIPEYITRNYKELFKEQNWPSCKNQIRKIEKSKINFWLERIGIERLEYKTQIIKQLFIQSNSNWEETFLQFLASSMGFKVNKEPFALLMQRTPYKIILKESSSLFKLEALLFGQAGLLETECKDEYFINLKTEYDFLKSKYNLIGLPAYLWKFARMRPYNFPSIRIAQFAALIFKHTAMVAELIKIENVREYNSFFDIEVSDYWHTHYRFGSESKKSMKKIGEEAVNLLLINVVAPFVFFYGKYYDDELICSRAIDCLASIPPENNYIIRSWNDLGISADSALGTQALLQLKSEYCLKHRCVHCLLGSELIKMKNATD